VSKWFDTGKLRGYRIPGSRDRRIPAGQLVEFMKAHGMPLDGLDGQTLRILIVDADPASVEAAAASLAGDEKYELQFAGNDFEAGMATERFTPHVVFVDVLGEEIDFAQILAHLRSCPGLSAVRVVAVAASLTAGQRKGLVQRGFDAAISKPYRREELTAAIERATDLVS
jgi:CheY-like chemotaxis protein